MLMEADTAARLGLLGGRLGNIVQQRCQLEQRRVRVAANLIGKVQPEFLGVRALVVQFGVCLDSDREWGVGAGNGASLLRRRSSVVGCRSD